MSTDSGRRLAGRVALVSGGGTGIGAAAARRLAAEGARVVVTGRRTAPLQAVAAEIDGAFLSGDVADPAHAAAAVALAVERFGGLDVVVCNAGAAQFGAVEEVTPDTWQRAFATNVEGALLAAKFAVPAMRVRGGGAFVLVASMAALGGGPHGAPYLASKAALLGLNRSIAFDYGPEKIRSNVVCPGWVRTDMANGTLEQVAAARGVTLEGLVQSIVRSVPLRRMAQPEEIAATIAFLASADSSFMTGTIIVADGGAAIVDAGMAGLIG